MICKRLIMIIVQDIAASGWGGGQHSGFREVKTIKKSNYSKQDFAQNKHCIALHRIALLVSSGQTEIIGVMWERRRKTVRAISATRSGVQIITWSQTAAKRGHHGRLRWSRPVENSPSPFSHTSPPTKRTGCKSLCLQSAFAIVPWRTPALTSASSTQRTSNASTSPHSQLRLTAPCLASTATIWKSLGVPSCHSWRKCFCLQEPFSVAQLSQIWGSTFLIWRLNFPNFLDYIPYFLDERS